MNIYKWLAYAVVAMLIVALLGAVGFYKDKATQNAIGRDEAIRIATGRAQETEVYRNKLGDTVRITRAAEVNLENFRALQKTKELEWMNKFERLRKSQKNVNAAGSIGSHFNSGAIEHDTVYVPCDTTGMVRAFKYHYQDAFNNIQATVLDTPRLDIRDKLYWVMEWERAHKFLFVRWGKKEWFQEVTNSNKLIKIDSQSVFVIRRRD